MRNVLYLGNSLNHCGTTAVSHRCESRDPRATARQGIRVFAILAIAITDHPGVIDVAISDPYAYLQTGRIPMKEAWSFWRHPDSLLSWQY